MPPNWFRRIGGLVAAKKFLASSASLRSDSKTLPAERVGARSRRHRDDAAGRVAVLRGVVVGDDVELLHRVDGQAGQLLRPRQADRVRRVAAVEDEVLVARAAARDGEHRIVLRGAAAGIDHDRRPARATTSDDGGAIRERQRRHHFAGDGLRDHRALRVQHRRGRLHFERLGLSLDVERRRWPRCGPLRARPAGRRRETGERDLDAIPAGHEGADSIESLLVADRLDGHAGVLVGDENGDTCGIEPPVVSRTIPEMALDPLCARAAVGRDERRDAEPPHLPRYERSSSVPPRECSVRAGNRSREPLSTCRRSTSARGGGEGRAVENAGRFIADGLEDQTHARIHAR